MSAQLFPHLLPMLIIALGALITIAIEPFLKITAKHKWIPVIALGSIICAGISLYFVRDNQIGSLLAIDTIRKYLILTLLAATAVSVTSLSSQLARLQFVGGEAYALILLSASGSMLMIQSTSLLSLFLGMELSAIPIYALVGMRRNSSSASEAMLKYFITGAVFSAIFLYGISLWYGSTGSLSLSAPVLTGSEYIHQISIALLFAGLIFKSGAFPFHSWVADAYSGAAIPVTGFMASTVKIAAITALGVLWSVNADSYLATLLAVSGLASIAIGTITGLVENSVRRILAFSGIANAGFLVLALLVDTPQALWYYLIVYSLGTVLVLGSFTALLSTADNADDITQLRGAARKNPLMGALATLGLISLSGMPPIAGFLAKFGVLAGLFDAGHPVIAFIAVGLTILAIGYYYRIARQIWEPTDDVSIYKGSIPLQISLAIAAAALVALSLWPHLVG